MARLERALDLEPGFTAASLLLGRIAFDGGDADLAIRTYDQALTHAQGRRGERGLAATVRSFPELRVA